MKKFCAAFVIALSVFMLSGCGGGGGSSVGENRQVNYDVKQVIAVSSPALERNKRYRIYKGASLSGMNGSRYYVSNTGSEALQSSVNLGFSEPISAGESFIIVNYAPDYETHSGSVVFAYDPSGVYDTFAYGGTVTFTGGSLMRYNALSLTGNVSVTDSAISADVSKAYQTERGITSFAMGRGSNPGFVFVDEESYTSRDIPSEGNVFHLVRKVNTFSAIVSEY